MTPPIRASEHDEKVVAISVLFDRRVRDLAVTMVRSDDFVDPYAKAVYELAEGIIDDDPYTRISQAISKSSKVSTFDQFNNGLAYIYSKWVTEVVAPARVVSVMPFIDRIRSASHLRKLQHVADSITGAIESGDIEGAVQLKDSIQPLRTVKYDPPKSVIDMVDELDAKMRPEFQNQEKRVPTGIAPLDEMIHGGFARKQMIVIAASTGVGKSAVTCQFAMNAALLGKKILIVSMEMNSSEIYHRMVTSITGVPSKELDQPTLLTSDQRSKVMVATDQLMGIKVDDAGPFTVRAIEQKCKDLTPDLLIVDYLQLLSVNRKLENRQLQVAENARDLKILANELDIPVIAVAQLNRAADGMIPKLSNLRESGEIENSANIVILLWRANIRETNGAAKLIVAKNRSGVLGEVDGQWVGSRLRFEDGPIVREIQRSPYRQEFDEYTF